MSTVDPRIAAYVEQVSQPGIPYVNMSNYGLEELYILYGEKIINDLLTAHWAEQRLKHINERIHE
jgi:hypothetical protein